jgi:predicted metalloprotease
MGRRAAPVAVAGGGIAGIIALLFALLGGGGGGSPFDSLLGETISSTVPSRLREKCASGADANERADCRIVGVVNSVQAYWVGAFDEVGAEYQPANTNFFEDEVATGCGGASSAVGPFYCPADQQIYIDLGFYDELRDRFGSSGGPLAEAYVIAHEYGHHVQHLTGTDRRAAQGSQGETSGSVRLELQADCYAGVWVANAQETGFLEPFSDADITDALSAAAAVGDDRIQAAATGRVDPESWTHGSAEQRQRWFLQGARSGDPGTCDTWSVSV